MVKTYFNWSTGKDSALALYYLQKNKNIRVDHLLTTINTHHNRISMHGLRREVYLQQLRSIGLSYSTVELPKQPTMEEYNKLMKTKVEELKKLGYTDCGFGEVHSGSL